MSAEKEIVNYWYNKRGFFTVNNIKTSNNRDAGILALRIGNNEVEEIFHVQVSCSITNNLPEAQSNAISKIIEERFDESLLADAVKNIVGHLSIQKDSIKRVMVVGALPKSAKTRIIGEFSSMGIAAIEFENILYDVIDKLDTQYYKNDIIRTLQLTKFLLLNEPSKMAKLLSNDSFTQNLRNEFLSTILNEDNIIKGFRKANTESVSMILKNTSLKPSELAAILGQEVLNRRTRKPFLNHLMEQEATRKIAAKQKRTRKLNMPLERFI